MTPKKKQNKIEDFIMDREKHDQNEQLLTAGRIINEIEGVDVNAALSTVKQRISSKNKIHRIYSSFSRYAAILLLALVVYLQWFKTEDAPVQVVENLTEQTISCPLGMRSQVVLPDGSKVWLNAGSTIRYSIPFTRESRKIDLIGEAYFDVVKNAKAPFSVFSQKIKVDVLGTQFNVKSYSEDQSIEVALREGSVNLAIVSGETEISKTAMIPNDHFTFDRNSKKAMVQNKDISSLIAWKDNMLVFDDTPILEMEKILERWYGVQIEITDKSIEKYKYTTTFENMPLEQVLDLLELSSPIETVYIPSRLNQYTNQLIPPKVIISKKKQK